MADNDRKFLIFFVGGQRYAFNLAQIAEVMDPATSWPIPLAPACYVGAINFHGSIVAVMDLAVFLDFKHCSRPEKIIVLDVSVASLGFLVERLARIVSEHDIEFHKAPSTRFASALLRLPEGDATLLDIAEIISKTEFLMNS